MGMLYKIWTLCTTFVLKSLYFSLFHSNLSYGLAEWGIASKINMNKMVSLQKEVVKAVSAFETDNEAAPLASFEYYEY